MMAECVRVRVLSAVPPEDVSMSFGGMDTRKVCVVEVHSGGLVGLGESWINFEEDLAVDERRLDVGVYAEWVVIPDRQVGVLPHLDRSDAILDPEGAGERRQIETGDQRPPR
jgi:hypothetical protein